LLGLEMKSLPKRIVEREIWKWIDTDADGGGGISSETTFLIPFCPDLTISSVMLSASLAPLSRSWHRMRERRITSSLKKPWPKGKWRLPR